VTIKIQLMMSNTSVIQTRPHNNRP